VKTKRYRFAEDHLDLHDEIVSALNSAINKGKPRKAKSDRARYERFLKEETLFQSLYRLARDNEQIYAWYTARECELKGYGWLVTARRQREALTAYALGELLGISKAEIEKAIPLLEETIEKMVIRKGRAKKSRKTKG
jgi:hypothetical protein